jgi:geranylgeranyl diphosphate synthase type I
MSLEDFTHEMRPAIESALQDFIGRSLEEKYSELRSMLTYHMGWEGEGAGPDAQGKRIRPLLVLLCAQAAGGNWRDALPAAVSVELLHNFSLIHDDIQDNSPLRRNRPTVWARWGAAQAINAGDVLFTLSFLAVQDLAGVLPPQSVLEVSRIIQQTCLCLTEGQYLDISYESKPTLPMEAYWPMIGGKTSALLACCTELGALVAGADKTCQDAFREYGNSLGLAFQVLDDWLGIWGDVALTGKSTESDLVSGKKSLPVLHALAQQGTFSRRWMQGKIMPDEAPVLARMMDEEGASAYTLETASRLTAQAINALQTAVSHNRSGCASDASRALEELTDKLLKRKN